LNFGINSGRISEGPERRFGTVPSPLLLRQRGAWKPVDLPKEQREAVENEVSPMCISRYQRHQPHPDFDQKNDNFYLPELDTVEYCSRNNKKHIGRRLVVYFTCSQSDVVNKLVYVTQCMTTALLDHPSWSKLAFDMKDLG
jgi:hypothetical protein